MDKIKVGVIGCGPRSIGSTIKNILNIREYELIAICDKYTHLMNKVVERYPGIKAQCYVDHKEMLKNRDIEAVFVVVEPENNAKIVCDALYADKDTYCDVPLALSIDECWAVVMAVEKTQRKFMMGEQMRYAPRILAWQELINQGRLGKILYVQGEYLHGMGPDRYYLDAITGERVHYKEALAGRKVVKSRMWTLKHPIYYLPHELSPLLKAINDRVTRVCCVGTKSPSYLYDWFPMPDMEVALMQTEKDVIMRMAAGFTIDTMKKGESSPHWHHIMGTKGVVEQGRNPESVAGQVYLEEEYMAPDKVAQVTWNFNPLHTSREILDSGHGGMDYWPYKDFAFWLTDKDFDASCICDVYRACEIAAPAILAGLSAEKNGQWQDVPDFRFGVNRRNKGEMPK